MFPNRAALFESESGVRLTYSIAYLRVEICKFLTSTYKGRQQNILDIKRPLLMCSVYSVNKLNTQYRCNLSVEARRFHSGENLSCGLHGYQELAEMCFQIQGTVK
jgi:hypothetical protein